MNFSRKNEKFESYYDILQVKSDCSPKEIRSAFLKLSKAHHPDRQTDNPEMSHHKFVKINEAYTVLSKPSSRMKYDDYIKCYSTNSENMFVNEYKTEWNKTRFYEGEDFHNFGSNAGTRAGPDYDYKREYGNFYKYYNNRYQYTYAYPPPKTDPKFKTHGLMLCAAFVVVGGIIEFVHYRRILEWRESEMARRSAVHGLLLQFARDRASANGREKQLENLANRNMETLSLTEAEELYEKSRKEKS